MNIALLISPSVSLAGLLLVFIGFLLNRASTLTSVKSRAPILCLVRIGLFPVGLALLCAAQCVVELAYGLRVLSVVPLFIGTLVVALTYAGVALRRVLNTSPA